jgi:hypothetical protein
LSRIKTTDSRLNKPAYDRSLFLIDSPVGNTPPKRIGMAIIRVRSAMFDPITFPKDKIELLWVAEVIPKTSSGNEVAAAIKKTLIEYSEIPMALAKDDDEVTIISTDFTSVMHEATTSIRYRMGM